MAEPQPPIDPWDFGIDDFLRSLAQIPWFSELGKPTHCDDLVVRIREWSGWPGPEANEVFAQRIQSWYDSLTASASLRKSEMEVLWERVHQIVFEHARATVPFDPSEDAWHGPTIAVWLAAFIAGIIACSLLLGQVIPDEALAQWRWYTAGHWPCGYACEPEEGECGVLMVL